ncbi:MAG: capsid protein [Planctomycetes bacterium]|nr:capsid protein [Planctomycetota bacterium]
MERHNVRTITSGKSATFPVSGRASVEYHTPGAEILGGAVKHGEKVITIDGKLISTTFLDELEDAKNHYDVRSIYSVEAGRALARQMDRHVLQVTALAARTTTSDVDLPAGGTITEASSGDFDDGDKLVEAMFMVSQIFDEKDVPEEDRFVYVKPSAYYKLIQSEKAINRDVGGEGSIAMGKIWNIAGLDIVKTTNLPTGNVTASTTDAGSRDAYVGDYTGLEFLAAHKSAVGTLKMMDLASRIDYDPRRLGWLTVAKYAVGHGVLRPEAAIQGMRA